MMTDFEQVVQNYIAIWNETDAGKRRELIGMTWTADATYVDPLMRGDGPDGIDVMIEQVQRQFPGFTFSLTTKVDGYNDRVRFAWEAAANGGPPLVAGTDFGVVAEDGRLQAVTGFLDKFPGA
jgi:hypothetical protein